MNPGQAVEATGSDADEFSESKVLDHLVGLVAGKFDELQIGERIDEHDDQDLNKRSRMPSGRSGSEASRPSGRSINRTPVKQYFLKYRTSSREWFSPTSCFGNWYNSTAPLITPIMLITSKAL